MKRGVGIAGALALLAISGWWAARFLPPTGVLGRSPSPFPAAPATPSGMMRSVPQAGSTTFPAAPAESLALSRLKTLEDILRSKNDNDPRLDRDFNDLSSEARRLFRKKYRELPEESRNERGTIVYLLGKNLRAAEDWAFLRAVVSEPPCRSLADCSKYPKSSGGGAADEVTLAYPSLVALKRAQRALEEADRVPSGRRSPEAQEAIRVIEAAKNSEMPAVARMVERLQRQFGASPRG